MKISVHLCERMIKKISSLLPNAIGILDLQGNILAHSEQSLVGIQCQGVMTMLSSGESSFLLPESEGSPEQIPGLYQSLTVNNEVTAVLLLHYGSQEEEAFLQIGALLQEYCQRVLADSVSTDYLKMKDFQKTTFYTEWLNGKYHDQEDAFLKKATEFGVHPSAGVTIAILHLYHIAFDRLLFLDIGEILSRMDFHAIAKDLDYILILNTISQERIAFQFKQALGEVQIGESQYLLAVGGSYPYYDAIQSSYQEARQILDIYSGKAHGIIYYSDVVLESYLNLAPNRIKRLYLRTLFRGCSQQEISDICNFIDVYVACNGSIHAVAEQQFTHKNTVQYRIEKIRKISGLDLRRPKDACLLQAAAFWNRHSENDSLPPAEAGGSDR